MQTIKKGKEFHLETPFGIFPYEPKDLYTFPEGIVGMEDLREFAHVAIPSSPNQWPFQILHSLEDPSVSFILLPFEDLIPLLSVQFFETFQDVVGMPPPTPHTRLMFIVTVTPRTPPKIDLTFNMKAPLLLGQRGHNGVQLMLPGNIPIQKKLKL